MDPLDLDECRPVDLVAAFEGDAKLFHLMVLALAEAKRPLTMDEICHRLERVGVEAYYSDLRRSLSKAWHGLEPVYKDPDEHYHLQLDSLRLRSILRDFEVLPERPRRQQPEEPEPIELPAEDTPLELDEIKLALGPDGAPISQFSGLRQTAAVLDVSDRPMSIESVCEVLRSARADGGPRSEPDPKYWGGRLVRVRDDGLLELVPEDRDDLEAMRAAIRAGARRAIETERKRSRRRARQAEYEAEQAKRDAVASAAAAEARRCILRVVPDPIDFSAAALVDVKSREFAYFLDGDRDEIARRLREFDVIAGIDILDTLHVLGVEHDEMHVVDLGPPQKTKTIDKRGRKLHLSAEMIIAHTIGKSNPLAEPGTITTYLEDGAEGKARRRLAADLKSLYAFYQYGVLHNFVRLRWGFLDEIMGVSYGEPGDFGVYAIARSALDQSREVEVVVGNTAPGWKTPWSRATRTSVEGIGYHWVEFSQGALPFEEIQAIRLIDGDS